MFAIFHVCQPDGTVVATSESHPAFAHVSPSLAASKRESEPALRDYIDRVISFHHYEVPVGNSDIRKAAA